MSCPKQITYHQTKSPHDYSMVRNEMEILVIQY